MNVPVRDNPPPLVAAASLVAIEGLLMILFGVLETANLSSERVTMGVTTSLFFVAYGGGLLFFAWQLVRGQSWARSPVVLAQLLQLGVAWSFRGGDTTWVAICLAVVALIVLAGLLHPRSVEALSDER